MEYLFPDLVIPELPPFREPTHQEITAWLRATKGVWTLELLRWLGRPLPAPDSDDYRLRDITYPPLSLAQQWWIICDLQDQT
jgi:hypothetical protein